MNVKGVTLAGLMVIVSLVWAQELKIEKIIISGNVHFSGRTIKKLMSSREKGPYNEIVLGEDLGQIADFYASQGFLKAAADSAVEEKRPGRVWIRISVREGERTRIGEVSFYGIGAFPEREVLAGVRLRAGQWLNAREIRAAGDTVVNFYKNSGYPYVTIERTVEFADSAGSADSAGGEARVAYSINEGKLVHIKGVQVWGNKKVATPVVLAATEIKPGERFSLRRIYDAQRRLTATGLFQPVNCRPLGFDERADSLVLSFDVHEQPAHSIGLGLGYETPNRFLMSADWACLNFFNLGHVLTVAGEFSPNVYAEYTGTVYLSYRIPYILRTKMDFTVKPFFNREVTDNISRTRTFSTNNGGAEAGTSHDLTREWRVYLLGRYKYILETRLDTSALDFINTKGITNSAIGGAVFDNRNDPFNPRRGFYFSPVLEAAGGLLGGNNDMYRMTFDARAFYFLFAVRLKAGAILPYGRTAVVPTYEQFTLGGGNSLRGYKDRSIGPIVDMTDSLRYHYGNCFVNANVEVRTPFFKNIGLVFFFDAGEMTLKLNELAPAGLEYSAGLGLRYNTPIGPVRVDYGRRLKDPALGGWGVISLGLFQVF